MLRCSCFTTRISRRFLSNWQQYDDQVGGSETMVFRYISRKRIWNLNKRKIYEQWPRILDIVMFAQIVINFPFNLISKKNKDYKAWRFVLLTKVSKCLCKNFFEANIICPKNLFDFSTKVQKCLWSCQMTLITSSKLTSVHPLSDATSFTCSHLSNLLCPPIPVCSEKL